MLQVQVLPGQLDPREASAIDDLEQTLVYRRDIGELNVVAFEQTGVDHC